MPRLTDTRRAGLRAFVAAAACCVCATTQAQPAWRFDDVERFVAVADIHGAYDAFEIILRKANVLDASLRWSGGNTHLVIVGDVLDRGPNSRKALDLIMRLQAEASTAGGAVHFVLGNHEQMNIVGDLRYVAEAEYAAFAAEERPQMRDAAFARLPAGSVRAEFDQRYPPGFFAHRAAFSPGGRYGAWLLEQPVLVTVNNWGFVHAGLAQASRNLLTEDINATLRQQLSSYAIALSVLTNEGVLGPDDNFYDHPARLEAWNARVSAGETFWSDAARAAANIVGELNSAFAFDSSSPTWYRGNVACSRVIEIDRLSGALAAAGVEHLVVGHTPTRDATISSRFAETLYRIDTGMLSEYYGGRAAALIVEGDAIRAIYEDGTEAVGVEAQAREVGLRPAGMSATQLETFLATAEVVAQTPAADGRWSIVQLRSGDVELSAAFTRNPGRRLQPDLAAWRLDLLLGLDMVPITVAREIDGQAGTLQYLAAQSVTEEQRQAERLGGGAWCPLNDQFAAMYVFDSLIGNTGRTADRLRYSTDSFSLMLLGHDMAFSSDSQIPAHLRSLELALTGEWIRRLQALDEPMLEAELGELLDRRRLRALLERRDLILRQARSRL